MWSSVLRSQIQFFFPTCLSTFGYFKTLNDVDSIPMTSFTFKVLLIVSLPVFSYFYLKKNHLEMKNQVFTQTYGTLYQNLKVQKSSAYFMTTLFCFKRIVIALSTVFLTEHVIVSIYVYCFSSLFQLGFNVYEQPMSSRMMNAMENLNEIAIYITSLFMFIFTDWIPEIETRYFLGYVYLPIVLGIVAINLGCIVYEIAHVIIMKY